MEDVGQKGGVTSENSECHFFSPVCLGPVTGWRIVFLLIYCLCHLVCVGECHYHPHRAAAHLAKLRRPGCPSSRTKILTVRLDCRHLCDTDVCATLSCVHQNDHIVAKNFRLQLHQQAGHAIAGGPHDLGTVSTVREHAGHPFFDGQSCLQHGSLVGSNNTGCCAILEFPQAQKGSTDLAFAKRSGVDELLLVC